MALIRWIIMVKATVSGTGSMLVILLNFVIYLWCLFYYLCFVLPNEYFCPLRIDWKLFKEINVTYVGNII